MSNPPIMLPSIAQMLTLKRNPDRVFIAPSGTECYLYSKADGGIIMLSGADFSSMSESEFNRWFQNKILEAHAS